MHIVNTENFRKFPIEQIFWNIGDLFLFLNSILLFSVSDPYHFDADPDPDQLPG